MYKQIPVDRRGFICPESLDYVQQALSHITGPDIPNWIHYLDGLVIDPASIGPWRAVMDTRRSELRSVLVRALGVYNKKRDEALRSIINLTVAHLQEDQ